MLGVWFDPIDLPGALARVESFLGDGQQHYIVTPNPEFVLTALKNKEFLAILNRADLSIPDGVGLLMADRILSYPYSPIRALRALQVAREFTSVVFSLLLCKQDSPIRRRLSGSDLFLALCQQAAHKGHSVFLLGAQEGVASRTANFLKAAYPNLKIVGTYAGSPSVDSDRLIRERLGLEEIDLLFVAYGHPRQEEWVVRNLEFSSAKVAVGVGGTFDYYSGSSSVPRAPGSWRARGLEWLWRLVHQPRKRGLRIFRAIVIFPLLVAREAIRGSE